MSTPSTLHSALSRYLFEIAGTPLLSEAEEGELTRRVADGDPAARDRLIRSNLRLVVAIARSYGGRGLPLEDLIGEGNVGLVLAADGFDPAAGCRFTSYAGACIRASIRKAIYAGGRIARVPHHLPVLVARWRQASMALTGELGRVPAADEIAGRAGLTAGQAAAVAAALRLSAAVGSGEPARLGAVADRREGAPGEHLARAEEAARALSRLDNRRADAIRQRFGLGGGEPQTFRGVGRAVGCTALRAHQLVAAGLARLREDLEPPRHLY